MQVLQDQVGKIKGQELEANIGRQVQPRQPIKLREVAWSEAIGVLYFPCLISRYQRRLGRVGLEDELIEYTLVESAGGIVGVGTSVKLWPGTKDESMKGLLVTCGVRFTSWVLARRLSGILPQACQGAANGRPSRYGAKGCA